MKVKVNNVMIDYEVFGQGKPVILIHGNGGSKKDFKNLILKLEGTCKVYALDSRCHGKSQSTKELTDLSIAEDVFSFITELKIEKPVVIGHSDGGIVALILAVKHSDSLKSIISCGANISVDGVDKKLVDKMRRINFILHSKKISLLLRETGITKEDLNKISIGALILAGENDPVLEEHTKEIAANIKDSECIILKGEDHDSYVLSGRLYDTIQNRL